jgi:coenzyme F420-0:L-glutamate ligase/coenzyme F420-1:gamma-L-glutamate ligase
MTAHLEIIALPDFPLVQPGDDLAGLIVDGLDKAGLRIQAGDVLVAAQKIFSKAENRYVVLDTVTPSDRAVELARQVDKDPRVVELILSESSEVVAHRPGVLVVAHRLGFVLANAGIDASNIENGGTEQVLLLPKDPDASCARLRAELTARTGTDVAVVMSDSLGRPWRVGTVGVAIGASGVPALLDLKGETDLFGRELMVTEVGLGDELAAAAGLVQGQAREGQPVVLVRGLGIAAREGGPGTDLGAGALVRDRDQDLFR